jgi:membrane associated rhomboid family serine protease
MSGTPVLNGIIKANVLVFFLWYLLYMFDPTFMAENFLVSWNGLKAGYFWTILTSVFSHNLLFHLFINMYFFYGFGKAIELTIGSKKFLYLYLFSGIVGSLGHCLVSVFVLHRPETQALGASGAIAGVLVFFALKFPHEKVYLLGLLPLPAYWGLLLFVGIDLWGLVEQSRGSLIPIGYGAHLGGALSGFLF